MPHNEVDGLREVFARYLRTARPILDGKGVITHLAQCDGKRKSLVDSTDIGKTTAGANDGKRFARLSTKEKQSRIILACIRPLVFIGIDVVKEAVPILNIIDHRVDGFHGTLSRHIVVVW